MSDFLTFKQRKQIYYGIRRENCQQLKPNQIQHLQHDD